MYKFFIGRGGGNPRLSPFLIILYFKSLWEVFHFQENMYNVYNFKVSLQCHNFQDQLL